MAGYSRADELHYRALKKGLEREKILLLARTDLFNKPGSPVYDSWENVLPLLVPISVSLFVLVLVGVIAGLVTLLASVLMYVFWFLPYIKSCVHDRIKERMLLNYHSFSSLWEMEGLALVLSFNKSVGIQSPDGDWKTFIALNLSNLMTEEETDSLLDVEDAIPALEKPEEKQPQKPAIEPRKTDEPTDGA